MPWQETFVVLCGRYHARQADGCARDPGRLADRGRLVLVVMKREILMMVMVPRMRFCRVMLREIVQEVGLVPGVPMMLKMMKQVRQGKKAIPAGARY
jgi:hypothetical protein